MEGSDAKPVLQAAIAPVNLVGAGLQGYLIRAPFNGAPDSRYLDMLATLTWRRGNIVATDVRPENAILAESDGEIYPFDFILSGGMPMSGKTC